MEIKKIRSLLIPKGGWLKRAIQLVILFIAGYWLYLNFKQSYIEILKYSFSINIPHLLIATLFFLSSGLLLGKGWQNILAGLGYKLSYFKSIYSWFCSLIFKYIPGKIWLMASRIYITSELGANGVKVIIGYVIECVLVFSAGIIAICASMPFWRTTSYDWRHFLLLLILPISIAIIHPSFLGRIVKNVLKKMGYEEVIYTFTGRKSISITGLFLLSWILAGAGFQHLIFSIHPQKPSFFPEFISIYGASIIGGAISGLPGGIGIQELTMHSFLSSLFEDDQVMPMIITIFFRFYRMVVEVLMASILFIISLFYLKNPSGSTGRPFSADFLKRDINRSTSR